MLRASVETGVVCQNEKHRKQKHARFSTTHSTWRSSKRPLSLTHSLAVFAAIAGRTADELLGPRRQTKQKYWSFKPDDTVNKGKVRRLCTVRVLFNPGCCQSQ